MNLKKKITDRERSARALSEYMRQADHLVSPEDKRLFTRIVFKEFGSLRRRIKRRPT